MSIALATNVRRVPSGNATVVDDEIATAIADGIVIVNHRKPLRLLPKKFPL